MLSRQQRHEADTAQILLAHTGTAAVDLLEALRPLWTDRDHQAPAGCQLADQGRRYRIGTGGDEDAVVRRIRQPAVDTVGVAEMHVAVAQRRKPPACLLG